MALPKIGWNEGSLLRRTILHVATFVLGSVAFVGLLSFVLVSAARGLNPHAADAEASGDTPALSKTAGAKPPLRKKGAAPSGAEQPKDE